MSLTLTLVMLINLLSYLTLGYQHLNVIATIILKKTYYTRLYVSETTDDDVQKKIALLLNKDTTSTNNNNPNKQSTIETIVESSSNKLVTVLGSIALGTGIFLFQHYQPSSSVALLKTMEKESPLLQTALCNGKPTIVDFYADWCENCKVMIINTYNYENIK